MASLVGGFFGRLNVNIRELTNVTVLIPLPPDATPSPARYFLIQTLSGHSSEGKTGRSRHGLKGFLGQLNGSSPSIWRIIGRELGLAPADRKGDRAVAQVDDDFSQCGCIPELSGCDNADEAVPLKFPPPCEPEGSW